MGESYAYIFINIFIFSVFSTFSTLNRFPFIIKHLVLFLSAHHCLSTWVRSQTDGTISVLPLPCMDLAQVK